MSTPKVTSTEVNYKKSFLIAICEGHAAILRAWKGKDEIALDTFTWFDGLNNANSIYTLIEEDYAEYKHLCCAYFEDYDLGNSDSIPNFTFEVMSIAVPMIYYGDCYAITTSGIPVFSVNNDNDVWKMSIVVDANGDLYIAGSSHVQKFRKVKGSTGVQEWELEHNIGGDINELSVDNSGNIYVSCDIHIANAYGDNVVATLYKFDTNGNFVWKKNIVSSMDGGGVPTRHLAVVSDNGVVLALERAFPCSELCKVTSNGDIDTSWGSAGYYGNYPTSSIITYSILALNDGSVVIGIHKINYYVQKLSPSGVPVWTTDIGQSRTNKIDVDSSGNLFCLRENTSSQNTRLYKLTSAGVIVAYKDLGNPYTLDCTGLVVDEDDYVWYIKIATLNTSDIFRIDNALSTAIEVISNIDYQYSGTLASNRVVSAAADANPSDVIKDLLTDTRYGAGINISYLDLDSFITIKDYCRGNDLLFSFVIGEQKPVLDWIDYICSHFNGYIYWSKGKIHLGCYRNESAAATITQSHLVVDGGENSSPPVRIKKRNYSDTCNKIELAWTDRTKNYNSGIVVAQDEVDQQLSGSVRIKNVDMAGITNATLAQKMAYLMLFNSLYRFSNYSFVLGYQDMLLEVGNVVDLSDGDLITNQLVRITSIEEDKDGRGLAVEGIEDQQYVYNEVGTTPQGSDRVDDIIPTELPDAISAVILESPVTPSIYLFVTPGGVYTNGWKLYYSFNGTQYTRQRNYDMTIGEVDDVETNSYGTLQSPLPVCPVMAHRSLESFTVDIGLITVLSTAISDIDFFNGRWIAKIGDEIIAYKTCEEISAGVWRVSNLIRGLYGTTPVRHEVGETFNTLNIDNNYCMPVDQIAGAAGRTIYLKLLTFYGNVVQQLEDVEPFVFTLKGVYNMPAQAGLLRIHSEERYGGCIQQYIGDTFTLYWNLASKITGFNNGGFTVSGFFPIWRYGDDLEDLYWTIGVMYGSYIHDINVHGVIITFYDENGVGYHLAPPKILAGPIGTIIESAEISLTNDLARGEEVGSLTNKIGVTPIGVTIDVDNIPMATVQTYVE